MHSSITIHDTRYIYMYMTTYVLYSSLSICKTYIIRGYDFIGVYFCGASVALELFCLIVIAPLSDVVSLCFLKVLAVETISIRQTQYKTDTTVVILFRGASVVLCLLSQINIIR